MLRYRIPCGAALLAIALLMTGCDDEAPPPILVAERMVTVHNQTGSRWSDVRVWLNDHYVAGAPTLEPGGRMTLPQRDFTAAMGQKFDPSRQHPYGVLVTATADGEEIRLVWGKTHRK